MIPPQARVSPAATVSRRRFLQLAGGTVALAALSAGCTSRHPPATARSANPASSAAIPATQVRGLAGAYGFLSCTALGPDTESAIRQRVAVMAQTYGIREFQFYDWIADYSTPTRGQQWTDAYFHRIPIARRTLEISLDEVHRQGGRAWAYVQAVAAEERDLENPGQDLWKVRNRQGEWYWHPPHSPQPRFPTYVANAAWARFMVDRWAPAVRQLGFDGIHWDTLGRIAGDYAAETAGIHAFLRTAQPLLRAVGLRQTMNMVDLAWWDGQVVREQLEFPYAEVWSEARMNQYFAAMDQPAMAGVHGVMAMYPTTAVPPGWNATQVIAARHQAARAHRLAYLVIGDGPRRLQTEYWPLTLPLTPEESALLRAPREPA